MKKFFVVMMCIIMTVCFMPTTAFAEGTEDLTSGAWDGTSVDVSWYNDTDTTFKISTAAQLAGLSQLVNEGNNFSRKTILLGADIDLANKEWTPIGSGGKSFNGTFDGGNNTVSNLKINKYNETYVGFFGKTANATLKNLNLQNVDVIGEGDVAALVGCGFTGTIKSVHVSGSIKVAGDNKIGGIAGEGYAAIDNCSVIADANTGSYVKSDNRYEGAYWTLLGGIRGFTGEGNVKTTNCTVKNIEISGYYSLGGITGNFHYGNTIADCLVENCLIYSVYNVDDYMAHIVAAIGGRTVNGSALTMSNCRSVNNTVRNGLGETISLLLPPCAWRGATTPNNIGVVVNGSNYQPDKFDDAVAAALAVDLTAEGADQSIYFYADYSEKELTKTQAASLEKHHIPLVATNANNKTAVLSAEAQESYKLIEDDSIYYVYLIDEEPEYAAKNGSRYYSDADKAIEEAQLGDTIFLRQPSAREKTILVGNSLTVVSETEDAVWTGAVPDENCLIVTETEGNATRFRAVVDVEKAEAKVGDVYFAKLKTAVANTATGKVEVLKNVNLGSSYISVGTDKDITVELNGYTVESDASYVFDLSSTGKMTVQDSSTDKTGTINGKGKYAVYTGTKTAAVIVNSGNIIGKTTGLYGWYGGTITVNGGQIKGGNYGLDMFDEGICTLAGGTIEGGTYSVYVHHNAANVNITGGMYKGAVYKTSGTCSISGGYFTSDPTVYLNTGKAIVTSDKAGFAYKVGKPVSVGGAEVSPAPDTTPKADVENIASDDKDAVKTAIESTSSTGLNAAAAAVAENPNKVTEDHVASGVNKVKTELNYSAASASNIKLVVQPYLDITAQSYTTTAEGNKELAVEITPKYNLLATKSDTDITTLNTTGTGETKNAVVIAENNILPVDQNTQVTITFQLPSGFITDGQMDKLFVVHTKKDGSKETYKANVTKSGENYIATFTTNGFSPFVFMVDSRTATVTFDGTPKTYVASNVGEVLPTSTAPSGKVFGGWTFEGISGTYTTLTDDLLTALNGRTVTATPYFYTPNYGGGGSTVTTPLDTAKSEASKAVSEYVKSSDYEAAEQAEIKAITEKAATDIKNAKTEAEVKTIEAAAKAEIDKLETAEEKAIIRTVEATKFKARSKATTLNGKKAIRVTWNVPEGMEFDGFEVYRSTEKYKGFGTEPIFITQNQKYTNNKGLEVGKTYYYKVRAFKYVNDEKVYTEYSYKAIRTVK